MTTTKVLVYTRSEDGGVSVVSPGFAVLPGESESDYLARVAARCVPQGTTYQIMERATLPASRRWRNAWRLSGSTIIHDLAQARLIRRSELEAKRQALLTTIRSRLEEADDAGQNARVVLLKTRRAAIRNLDLQAAVDGVADIGTLDTFEPSPIGSPLP